MSSDKQIYIADDETNIRLAIKNFLENAGYTVRDFENGDLLFAAFKEHEADLVILDVMMPGSSGFVICKELRKISSVPIFMLTSCDSDLDYATGLDLGSDDYLLKPFSPVALVMRVKAIFRRLEYERKNYERDTMTGLYSKTSGIDYIKNELLNKDESSLHALLTLDIDNFKGVNDNLGHAAGDKVIIETAEILNDIFNDDDIIMRFGGDEFVIFTSNIPDTGFAEDKAEELNNALRRTYGEGSGAVNISSSIGIAFFPIDGKTYEELFEKADSALYTAKENGKDTYTIYKA